MLDQDWNDAKLSLQGGLNLHTHPVVLVFDARPASSVTCRQPARPDHDEHDIALLQGPFDGIHEVIARLQVVDVEEHFALAQLSMQSIEQAPRMPRRVLSAIADEYLGHWRRRYRIVLRADEPPQLTTRRALDDGMPGRRPFTVPAA